MKKIILLLAFLTLNFAAQAAPLFYFGTWKDAAGIQGYAYVTEDDELNTVQVTLTFWNGSVALGTSGYMTRGATRFNSAGPDGRRLAMAYGSYPEFNWRGTFGGLRGIRMRAWWVADPVWEYLGLPSHF